VPKRGLQIHGAAIAQDAIYATDHLADLNRLIVTLPRIASRNHAVAYPMHQSVHHKSFILPEYDDRTWLQFG
jgi:hypothetical protein